MLLELNRQLAIANILVDHGGVIVRNSRTFTQSQPVDILSQEIDLQGTFRVFRSSRYLVFMTIESFKIPQAIDVISLGAEYKRMVSPLFQFHPKDTACFLAQYFWYGGEKVGDRGAVLIKRVIRIAKEQIRFEFAQSILDEGVFQAVLQEYS